MSFTPRAPAAGLLHSTCVRLGVAVLVALGAVLSAALVPLPAHAARTLAPCAYEDGPGPCVWDARHRGNGTGDSFIVRRDGRVVHVTHRRAHRLSR